MIDAVAAGQWWDAVVVEGVLGRVVAAQLQHTAGERAGPVLCDPGGPKPRVYFLTPAGTADRWAVPGSVAFGECCYVVLNGTLDADTAGVHWLVAPLCRHPEPLVAPQLLRALLTEHGSRP
ncbi:hypothetical protein ACFU99_22585 [Streptomyces sp. NPDC057654]|uniref:hypothetical protein n=1 Tax=Streptomyces sp. NPDC057654 TaxID=3346196 RepID=UPI003681712D